MRYRCADGRILSVDYVWRDCLAGCGDEHRVESFVAKIPLAEREDTILAAIDTLLRGYSVQGRELDAGWRERRAAYLQKHFLPTSGTKTAQTSKPKKPAKPRSKPSKEKIHDV